MKLLLLLVAVAACQALPAAELSGRIVRGDNARPGQFPWQVALTMMQGIVIVRMDMCGGSLIHPQWVLTAAHCISGKNYYLTIGSTNRDPFSANNTGKVIKVTKKDWIVHEKYVSTRLTNDVALIKLPYPVALNKYVQTIKMSNSTDFVQAGEKLVVSGWGTTENNKTSDYLKYTEMVALSQSYCRRYFKEEGHPAIVDDRLLCAQSPEISSPCHGDSGGPIVQYKKDGTPVLVGTIAFISYKGCLVGAPSGYMRLSTFRNWIESKIGERLP